MSCRLHAGALVSRHPAGRVQIQMTARGQPQTAGRWSSAIRPKRVNSLVLCSTDRRQ